MTLKHLSLKLYLHVGVSTVSESSATGKSLKTWNDFDIFALLLLLSFFKPFLALCGWLQKNLRRSLICHQMFMFYFIAVSKWSNYHELIYPTEHLQYSKTCFWLREKFRTSGVWCKSSRCWKWSRGARERCFWLLQLLEHLIFFRAMSAFCVSLVVLTANMFAAWESEKITVEGAVF